MVRPLLAQGERVAGDGFFSPGYRSSHAVPPPVSHRCPAHTPSAMPPPSGLRASEAPRLHQLCGDDRRLLLRLGTLLREQVAVSELLLGELPRCPGLRELLLHPGLAAADAAGLAALVGSTGCTGLDPAWSMADGWKVLVLADELGNPLFGGVEPAPTSSVAALLPGLSRELRAPVEGLLQAQGDEQRAAALEQLRYAAPPLAVVAGLMPLVLADAAALVRERAISLLVAAGARATVIDLIRALQLRDDPALRQLLPAAASLHGEQAGLAIAALAAAVTQGHQTGAVLDLATALAEDLARHPALPRLLELLVPRTAQLGLVGLVRAVQRYDPSGVEAVLRGLLGQSAESDATLIILLARPHGGGDAALFERGLELLLTPDALPRERLTLAGALRRLDPDGRLPRRLAESAGRLPGCREHSPFWLIAELSAERVFPATEAAAVVTVLVEILQHGDGARQIAILEHRLLGLLPAPEALRRQALRRLADLSGRLRDRRSRELMQQTCTDLGPAVLPDLWELVAEHPEPGLRQCARLALVELLGQDPAACAEAALRLTGLARQAGDGGEVLDLLTVAAALARRSPDPAPTAVVDAAARELGDRGAPVWGHLLAGPHLAADRRSALLDRLVLVLTTEVPAIDEPAPAPGPDGEPTYVLDNRLGDHTESIPRALEAAARCGASPHLSPVLLRRLVASLCRQWQLVASWKVVWGPANVQELAQCLGRLAQAATCPPNLRLHLAEALLPRATHLAVAAILAGIAGDPRSGIPALAEVLGRAVRRIMQQAAARGYADDELGDLCETLVGFLLAADLGEDGPALRRQLASLLAGWKDRLAPRSTEQLRAAWATLDEDLRGRMGWLAR